MVEYSLTSPHHRFALEVMGKNGCLVKGVLHLPRKPLVKLDSQDLQIGDRKFYFLLPTRCHQISPPMPPLAIISPTLLAYGGQKERAQVDFQDGSYYHGEDGHNEDGEEDDARGEDDAHVGLGGKKGGGVLAKSRGSGEYGVDASGVGIPGKAGQLGLGV